LPFFLVFIIIPVLLAAAFPGNSNAGRQINRYLNEYPYYILASENTRLSRLLFALFSKADNNKRPIIYYTRIGYLALAILQIPVTILINNLGMNVFAVYFSIFMAICVIPYILFLIMVGILEHKEKIHKKQMGIEPEGFWDVLKADRRLNALEKQRKHEVAIHDAVKPYIRITNPKKRKATIVADDIEKVNTILKKDFPSAHTELTTDKKGNKVFCVHCKEEEDRLLVQAYVIKHR
jgi:hypothetical protein